jgi:hypothetical protein
MSGRSTLLPLLVVLLVSSAHGQSLVPPDEAAAVAKQFNDRPVKNTLECDEVSATRIANLGFDLRYHAGFFFKLPMKEMPEGGRLEARLRVTPEAGAPVLLAEYFEIPTVSEALKTLPQPAEGPIVASAIGGFVTGAGKYKTELLLFSPDNKTCFKQWSFKTESSPGSVALAKLNSVQESVEDRWDGKLDPHGIRLTLLLNATAISTSQAKLWEYRFLLNLIEAILEQVPCRSLRVVAFNLDQQAELFRRDEFALSDLDDLKTTLKDIQLSAIDYRVLSTGSEPEFLTRLVENEATGSSNAVIVVGRRTRHLGKTQIDIKPPLVAGAPKLYYLRHDWHDYNPRNLDPIDSQMINM